MRWPWKQLPRMARFVGGGSPEHLIAWVLDDGIVHLKVFQPS
jgi:hypothetical protein